MKITSQVIKQKLSPFAEDIEEEPLDGGSSLSVWFNHYFSTYFFSNEELVGIYIEYNGKKYYTGACIA